MDIRDRLSWALAALQGRDFIGEQLQKAGVFNQGKTVPWGAYGKAKSPDTRLEPLVKSGWRRNELIYTCVSKKASTASQVRLDPVDSNEESMLKHPLRTLLASPNPHMTESEFWGATIILMDFAGNAYYEKVRSASGRTVELWPMRPDWMKAVPDERGEIAGYFYQVPGQGEPTPFKADDVLVFELYDPINGLFGYPPVAVCARSGDADNSVTDYIRLLFEEGGVPPGILTSKQSINEVVAEQIRALWMMRYGGASNWTKGPAVLGNDTQYQRTGLGLQEMGIDLLDKRDEGRICMTLKVPAVIANTNYGLERATLDNVKAYHKVWWEDDLMPLYKSFADTIYQQIVKTEYPEGVALKWNFDDVPALQEQRQERRQKALEAFKAGAITRNEFNREWGLEDLGPAGEVYVISSLMVEVPAGALMQQPDDEEPDDQDPDDEEDDQDKGAHAGHSHKAAGELPPHEKDRGKFESQLKSATLDYFDGLLQRIEKNLKELLARKNGKGGKASKQIHPQLPEFWSEEGQILYNALFEIILDATQAAAKDAFSVVSVELGVSWEVINESAISWAAAHTEAVVAKVSKTSMDAFLTEFEPWLQSGEGLDALIKNLTPYYGKNKAEQVAVSETTRSFAQGNVYTWKEMGGYVKSFDVITAEDDLVCPICLGEQDANPHELDAELPSYHVRCRCGVRPNTE